MDGSIRSLLHNCRSDNKPESLLEPYEKLKRESSGNVKANVGTDLFVLCAEVACQHKKFNIAEDCIKMYFKHSPPGNQYLCRAYMCQAQIHAPTSTKNPEQIDKAVLYLLKAINFAKQNSRYNFLVYNASVLYWQFCRFFLKPNYKRFLAKSLHQVVKSLDEVDDGDYEWRAQLMIALIECYIDAGRKDDASQIASSASQFTRNNVPNLYKDVLALQIQYRLTEYGKLSKETKSSPDLHLFFKIHRLKVQLAGDERGDVGVDLAKFYKQLTGMSENDVSGTSTEFSEKSSTSTTSTPVAMETNDRLSLILELAKLCMSYGVCRLASDCLDYVERNSKEPSVNLVVEFLRCELMVKSLGEKQENYSQSIVQVRLQAIEKLEQYLMTSLRFGDSHVIQVGCMSMWNLCLPLLQFNLRYHVRKPLSLLADALESVDSLNSLLRCQIHTELAKCEESEEQVEQAMLHLRKALSLDDDGVYTERLETLLTRLQLRATLYTTPERPEDVAAMIIEQARTSSDSGTSKMKRASLVKAGNALAPDAFAMVLESENESKDMSHGKKPPTLLSRLAARAEHFEKAVTKAAGHLKRLGTQNDQERVRIWAELTKTARKQQVWDVARVAARFCLLYDDERWSLKRENKQTGEDEGGYVEEERNNEGRSSSGAASVKKGEGQSKRFSYVTEEAKYNVEKDLLRMLAEVHFINAEALIQFRKSQGVELCDSPTPPSSECDNITPREPQVATQDSPQWITYCDWLRSLSQSAVSEFQRASELGSELQETWLVCNSAVYLLNYTTHLVAQQRHRELVPILTSVLKNMRSVGHVGESSLLCQVCNILAQGLMKPWYPSTASKTSLAACPSTKKADVKKEKNAVKNVPKITTAGFDSDTIAELKQALEYLDYGLQVTNGSDTRNLVAISVRHSLIKTWVHCKQLLSQQIPKNFGSDSEDANSQAPMSRCLCAVEMLSVNRYGLNDFSSAPTLQEVVRMVGNCVWSDDAVALEVWSRLAVLAFNADNHSLVMECGKKALAFADENKDKKKVKNTPSVEYNEKTKQQLLYYACVIMGQSIARVMKGQAEMRRDALEYFVKACRFGELAKSYDFVITAARHYWNAVIPLVNEPLERQLLKEPLEIVLQCLTAVSDKNLGKGDEDEDEEEENEDVKKTGSSVKQNEKKKKKDARKKTGKKTATDEAKSVKTAKSSDKTLKETSNPSIVEPVSVYEEDLKMRAAMYGVLFQAFADQGEWEKGLRAMDDAVRDMPRTPHRLLIFKHRVITKAKLGRDVQFDMGKFKDESELVISSLWHHVAVNSCEPREQLKAYQNAIDILQEEKSDWQKVDFLLELGEWLFVNELPVQDALDQFMVAIDILINRSEHTKERAYHDDVESEPQSHSSTERSSVLQNGAQLNGISDVKTLEYLARVHIMLAQLVGRKSSYFTDYCLFAVACVQRIWKLFLDFAEVSHDGTKPGDSTPTKKGNKNKEQKEGKGEKSSGKTCFPSTLHNWATFEIPEKFVEYFKNEDCGKLISKTSFVRPAVSVYYLNILVDHLCCCGYHHLCLPITSLLRCLAKHVIENELLLKLIHWRTMEICQDLGLVEDARQHERIAKDFENQKEEVAKSREEIELWKEKQREVKKEEEKHLKTSEMAKNENKQTANHTTEVNNWMAGRREEHQVERREIWIQQAAILIKQGYYQAARELLNEANTSALAFNDRRSCAEVFYHLALLAYQESNWKQSITLLQELQNFKVDQRFWLKTVLLMVDAICEKRDKDDPQGTRVDIKAKRKAIMFLKQSTSTFKLLCEDSPNKACMAEYVAAKLQAKLGFVTAMDVADETQDDEMFHLLEACEHLRSSEVSLLSCGHRQEAIDVRCERAAILRRLATNSKTKADRRNLYLEALTLLRSAVRWSDTLSTEVASVCGPEELCQVSLSAERESVRSKLCFGELAIEIMNEHATDERARRNKEARKGSVEKLIDAFIEDVPVMTDEEKKWSSVTRSIVDETLVHLTVSFKQSASTPYLKAKCYLVLGKCLRTSANYLNPDDEPQWKIEQATAEQLTFHPTSVDEESPGDENDLELEQTSKDFNSVSKRSNVAELLKVEYKDCQQITTQAVECLVQCVQLALKHGYNEIVSEASYLLVEIIGRHDMSTSSSYLALYQSCSMAQTLRKLVERCQTDSSLSRLAALMRQRNILATQFLHQQTASSVLASNTQTLGEFEAWRRLSISKNHLELVKELSSSGTLYLVLQHSKDRSYLYAATLDKPRSGMPSAKPGKQATNTSVSASKAITCRSKVHADDLDKLLKTFEKFRGEQATELIRQNYLRRHVEETQSMLADVDDQYLQRNKDVLHDDLTVKENEDNLQKLYLSLIHEMESYLSPVLEQLMSVLDEKAIPETVVILADEYLLRLPVESLSVFRSSQVQCLARDLSLQMHHYRFHSTDVSESRNDVKKGGGGKKAGKVEAPTTAKSQDKKGEKKISKEQGIAKEGIAVDISGLRYIVDPHNECASKEDESPEKVFNDVIVKYRQLSAKWSGLTGVNHVASVGEWQKLMKESSVFLFYGTQRCLNYVPPSLMVSSSLQECNIMLILDHVETTESFLRQSTVDASKTCSALTLECPFESAAILSLTGVNCIIANQWNCKLRENKEKFVKILEVSIDESKNIGSSLRAYVKAKPKSNADTASSDVAGNIVNKDPSTTNVLVLDNPVLYGVPYFMLNPLKA